MLRLRHAETQAQEASERYRMMVESAIDYAIFTCGLDGRITSWNTGATKILSWLEEEMLGETLDRLFTLEDRSRGLLAGEMDDARRLGRRRDEGSPTAARGPRSRGL